MRLEGPTIRAVAVAAALFSSTALAAAQNVTIGVWAGGSGPNDNYRVDAIDIAADLLEREYAIGGKELSITVEKKMYPTWDDFKQALTLAAEAGTVKMAGGEGIKERADFLAMAVKTGITLEDLAFMENVYSPPIGALNEPIALAAQNALSRLGT